MRPSRMIFALVVSMRRKSRRSVRCAELADLARHLGARRGPAPTTTKVEPLLPASGGIGHAAPRALRPAEDPAAQL